MPAKIYKAIKKRWPIERTCRKYWDHATDAASELFDHYELDKEFLCVTQDNHPFTSVLPIYCCMCGKIIKGWRVLNIRRGQWQPAAFMYFNGTTPNKHWRGRYGEPAFDSNGTRPTTCGQKKCVTLIGQVECKTRRKICAIQHDPKVYEITMAWLAIGKLNQVRTEFVRAARLKAQDNPTNGDNHESKGKSENRGKGRQCSTTAQQ